MGRSLSESFFGMGVILTARQQSGSFCSCKHRDISNERDSTKVWEHFLRRKGEILSGPAAFKGFNELRWRRVSDGETNNGEESTLSNFPTG